MAYPSISRVYRRIWIRILISGKNWYRDTRYDVFFTTLHKGTFGIPRELFWEKKTEENFVKHKNFLASNYTKARHICVECANDDDDFFVFRSVNGYR